MAKPVTKLAAEEFAVLFLAPGAEAAVTAAVQAAGLAQQTCDDTRELGSALAPPGAALLIASAAALPSGAAHRLHHELQASYHRRLGMLLLASQEASSAAWTWLAECKPPGYATVLVEPSAEALASAVQIALLHRRGTAVSNAEEASAGPVAIRENGMVEAERLRLRALLEALPAAVLIVDAGGRVRETSAATAALLGGAVAPAEELTALAARLRAWRPDGSPLEFGDWSLVRALRSGAIGGSEELVIEALDGQRKTILTNTLPIRNAEGAVSGAVAIAIDISSLKRAEQQLKAVNERLEERVAERTATVLLLHEVASAANRARSLEEALALILQPIARQHGWSF